MYMYVNIYIYIHLISWLKIPLAQNVLRSSFETPSISWSKASKVSGVTLWVPHSTRRNGGVEGLDAYI